MSYHCTYCVLNVSIAINTGMYDRRLAIRHMELYVLVHFVLLETYSEEIWNLQKDITKTKKC
jgi:hypothetical protein